MLSCVPITVSLACTCPLGLGHFHVLVVVVVLLLLVVLGLHQAGVLRIFLPPAEGVEHVEESHRDVDEDYQGEQGI